MRQTEGIASIDNAWQSVSLEERLELISRAHATGVLACVASIMLMGGIAYGLDKIWILGTGVAGSLFVFPLFASYSWRREKPALILAYLAVRAVARRYAYGYSISDFDIVLIYRGKIKEVFRNREEEEIYKQTQALDFDSGNEEYKDVWIVLMRGGLVILSEKLGGAKLEFITQINHESVLRPATPEEEPNYEKGLYIEGVGQTKGRSAVLVSKYPAAHYVFEKRFLALVEEHKQAEETQERLRAKTAS